MSRFVLLGGYANKECLSSSGRKTTIQGVEIKIRWTATDHYLLWWLSVVRVYHGRLSLDYAESFRRG